MGLLQKIYDGIKGFKTPSWLKTILQQVQDILITIALQVGREYLNDLQKKMIEVSQSDISNEEKFRQVFDYGKMKFAGIKDSYLNLLIEVLVNRLKANKVL